MTFTYLGSSLSRDGDVLSDVNSRIEKASRAFGSLRGPICNNSNFTGRNVEFPDIGNVSYIPDVLYFLGNRKYAHFGNISCIQDRAIYRIQFPVLPEI